MDSPICHASVVCTNFIYANRKSSKATIEHQNDLCAIASKLSTWLIKLSMIVSPSCPDIIYDFVNKAPSYSKGWTDLDPETPQQHEYDRVPPRRAAVCRPCCVKVVVESLQKCHTDRTATRNSTNGRQRARRVYEARKVTRVVPKLISSMIISA